MPKIDPNGHGAEVIKWEEVTLSSISVAVELHDESGAHTLSATVEWFITRISDATGNV
jgi:hypothetical protein